LRNSLKQRQLRGDYVHWREELKSIVGDLTFGHPNTVLAHSQLGAASSDFRTSSALG